jgi:hypothetical protein
MDMHSFWGIGGGRSTEQATKGSQELNTFARSRYMPEHLYMLYNLYIVA